MSPAFGRLLRWRRPESDHVTEPDVRHLRRADYAGHTYTLEYLSRARADQLGAYPGWHLWVRTDRADYDGQLACNVGGDLATARCLAEVRIVTDAPTYNLYGQPLSLFRVMGGTGPIQDLAVGGGELPVAFLPDSADAGVVARRWEPPRGADSPYYGEGDRLAEVRAEFGMPADVATDPVTVRWTPQLVNGQRGGTHTRWDDAYEDLVALLREWRPLDAEQTR